MLTQPSRGSRRTDPHPHPVPASVRGASSTLGQDSTFSPEGFLLVLFRPWLVPGEIF